MPARMIRPGGSDIGLAPTGSRARRRGGPRSPRPRPCAGLTRWVRPPRPWRPSKLRLEVEAQRSPGSSLSAFIARHMEQPGSRHSKPASRKMLVEPFLLGLVLHQAGARHDHGAARSAATLRPLAIAAAARRSSMRPLVQEPMKTRSIGTSVSRVPGVRPM